MTTVSTDAPPPPFDAPAGDGARVTVSVRSFDAAVDAVRAALSAGRGFGMATLNLDHLVKLRRSAAFRDAYGRLDMVTADGNPIVWLSCLAGRPVSLAPGSDLVRPLCAAAAETGAPVALYGANDATLAAAAEDLRRTIPGLAIAFVKAPPYEFDPLGEAAEVDARTIGASGARLCLVALGAPKQEIFAARALALAPGCGFACIGAGLDFIAGSQRRAPLWVRRLALEWVWRMLTDPGRLARRYFDCAMLLPGLAVDALGRRADSGPR
jgi:N-acetylglucosaminyldiphosphoundecaprenol N-acetyl-beta-D-mannosaminyltransferase